MADDVAGRRTGLLVVDVTRALADPAIDGHAPAGAAAAEQCALVLDGARAAGLPVWFTRGGKRWHTSTGSPLAEVERGAWLRKNGYAEQSSAQAELAMQITPQLQPRSGEVVLSKTKPSAFFATPLISQLITAKVDRLIIVGMMTSGCVRATVTDAFSYDLDVIIPVECLADVDVDAHEANLSDMGRKYATTRPTAEVTAALHASPRATKAG